MSEPIDTDKLYMSDPKAATVAAMVEALTILSKYMKKGMDSAHFTSAEHDVLYVATMDSSLSARHIGDEDFSSLPKEQSKDGLRLIALGWHYDSESDGWAYFT